MRTFNVHLKCPYPCCKGETLSDGRAKVSISIVCSKCGNVYVADLDTMRTHTAKPQKRYGRH